MGIIGVDVGRSAHFAVGLDDDGKRLIARAVANRQRDINDLVSWAAEHDASVVVDQPNGGAAALIQACWDRKVAVGYLHGLAMARARDFYEGEAKTDPKDAFVIADVARTHPSRIVALSPVPDERARLELLCGRDEDLRADIVRATNRLRQLLSTYWPAYSAALGERLVTKAGLALVGRYPDPRRLPRLGVARLTSFLKQQRARGPSALAQALIASIKEQHTDVNGAGTAAELVAGLAQELQRLQQTRETNGQEIEAAFFVLPEAPILLSLPGIGPRLGAKIMTEIGDIARFPTPAKLASYAGLGPSTRQSGTSLAGAVPSRRGNHRLKNALFLAAFASLRHPPSRAYYDRKRTEGKRHNDAVMCLARRRVDVLHAMLVKGESYRWSPVPDPSEQAAA